MILNLKIMLYGNIDTFKIYNKSHITSVKNLKLRFEY